MPISRLDLPMETNEFLPTSVLYKDQSIEVRGDEFSLSFNLENGFLEKYNYRNNEVIKNSLKPFFWRAPTDNDLGNGMPERCDIWRMHMMTNNAISRYISH